MKIGPVVFLNRFERTVKAMLPINEFDRYLAQEEPILFKNSLKPIVAFGHYRGHTLTQKLNVLLLSLVNANTTYIN